MQAARRRRVPVCTAIPTERGARAKGRRRRQPGDRVLTCPLRKQAMLGHPFGGPGNIVPDEGYGRGALAGGVTPFRRRYTTIWP